MLDSEYFAKYFIKLCIFAENDVFAKEEPARG